jgi:hypothetical protein
MSVEVLVNTDDITVLGPPAQVNVQLDIGATGNRGSQVFVGTGNPNDVEIGQDPILNDLYINNAPGDEYSYMYQYISGLTGLTWIPILKVNPTIYSANHLVSTWTSGSAIIRIPIANIVQISGASLTEENFSVKFSIGHSNPVAASISAVAITGSSNENLVITLKAAELTSGTWQNLSAPVTVHTLITVILDPISEES